MKLFICNAMKLSVLPLLFLICSVFCTNAWANDSANSNEISIMSYNIRNAKGLDNITDYQRIADVILRETPDVVALQEIDSVTGRSKGVDVLKEIAVRTSMYHVYNASIVYDGGKYGVGILSKEQPLSHYGIPLPGREEQRSLLIVEFGSYVVGCTHLSLTPEDRILSIDMIRNEAVKLKKPFFLAGDLNATPESDFIKELQKDFILLNNTENATFPANEPRRCIDYIAFHIGKNQSGETPFAVLSEKVVDESVASDHRPIIVRLSFKSDLVKKN